MSRRSLLFIICSVITALAVFCPVQFGQTQGQKGMSVEKAPVSIPPCGTIVSPFIQKEGAKGLFFDPASGIALNANPSSTSSSRSSRQRTSARSQGKGTPASPPTHTSPTLSPDLTDSTTRPATRPENTGLKFWIELIEPTGDTRRVLPTRTFHTGERIRFHFESNVDGYIALTLLEATGTAKTLFPTDQGRAEKSFIEHQKDNILPAEDAWFRFDDQVGTERILVFFSKSHQAIDQLQLQPEMETRSVAVLTQKAQEGSKGIFVEFDGASTPANQVAYFVNPSSDSSAYVVLEICINHER